MAARVVLPPSGTTLLFVAPRNAVAARLTCRKRFRPIYSCSRIRMDYSPASLRPGEPSVDRLHSPRRACSRATRANVGTPLEPFASLRTLEEPRSGISCWNFNGLIGGRTRTRTLDPLIKSQRVPTSAYFDAPRRISVRYWFEDVIRCELNHSTTITFTQFHLPMLTLRFPGRLRSIPWRRKN